MKILSSKASARFLVLLATLVPSAFLAKAGFAAPVVATPLEQTVSATPSMQFSANTAAKLQYLDADQQIARVFVRENGPSFVRKIRPFVRENGPSFVRSVNLTENELNTVASQSAVEVFAALQNNLGIS